MDATSHPVTRFGTLKRLPLIGYALRWLAQLARLPMITPRLDRLDAAVNAAARHTEALRSSLAEVALRLDEEHGHASLLDGLLKDSAAHYEALRAAVAAAASRTEAVEFALREVEARKADVDALREIEAGLSDAGRRLVELRRDTLPASIGASPGDPESARFDAYYRAFEERFRGTREEILQRLSFYLPMVSHAAGEGGQRQSARFLDLGCGRGEFVEMLAALGLSASGIDTSEAMLAACRERGLHVLHADAVAHLGTVDSGSIAGIACIHVLEHLPFRAVLRLCDEAFRVLRPGGVAIFEMPNPENLIVGACNFYYDPTHMRPLPPEPMRYLMQTIGFARVDIERLHPGKSLADIDEAADPVTRLYSTIMNVPQDYALIAYKAPAPADAAS